MSFKKLIVSVSHGIFGAVIILSGLGIIILAFMNSPLQLQIVMGLVGLGLISLGLAQVKRAQDGKGDKERFEQIMTRLNQIQQELQKEKKPERGGTVIADILGSGLKYYADKIKDEKSE
ncbi:hypothetical protein ACFLWZ_07530 [Chloroflexota bacterium]